MEPMQLAQRNRTAALAWGAVAALALVVFYLVVLRLSSGSWAHVAEETQRLWYWLLVLSLGFGVQIGLVVTLRQQPRERRLAVMAGGVGAGTSTGAMLACCAHHLAEVLPLVGLSALAVWLVKYQVWLIAIGVGINFVSILYLWRKVRQCHRHAVYG